MPCLLGTADADDAWSETFLSAMRAYPDLPADANVEAWLVTIAHRKALDVIRAASRRAVPTAQAPDAPAPPRPDGPDPDAFDQAIRSYWSVRDAQAAKQLASGKVDAGSRGSVTGGGHLDAILDLLEQVFVAAGFDRSEVMRRAGVELPGYCRPTKKWDLVVFSRKRLVAAIELKSQVGPSFGNNFNNRTEEAIGNAVDVWRAYEEGTFGAVRPWLGYVFLLEETGKSVTPVRVASGVFRPEPIFDDREARYRRWPPGRPTFLCYPDRRDRVDRALPARTSLVGQWGADRHRGPVAMDGHRQILLVYPPPVEVSRAHARRPRRRSTHRGRLAWRR
ncbi:MAG: hypothetical protein L0H64_05785 [Pseudonocardia sp.]|nr:hypothetical protein [Pseudonocardia sp.]